MERIVVVGVDTTLGAGVAQGLKMRSDVWGISSNLAVGGEDGRTRYVPRDDCHRLVYAIEELEPECVVYASSLSASSWDMPACERAWQDEPAVAESLVLATRRLRAKLIGLSSDVVFTGPKMFHDEGSPTSSAHPAASAVLAWEQILVAGGALVARTHAYGWAPAGCEAGLVERIVEALRTGAPLPVDGQRHATPILAAHLAPLLVRAAEVNLTGVFHLSGAERTSSYRLAGQLASILGRPMTPGREQKQILPADGGWLVETSLDSRRARRALGMPLPMLSEGLHGLVESEPSGGEIVPPIQQAA